MVGVAQAKEWLNRDRAQTLPQADLTAWRATCYADAVQEHERKKDFMLLLNEWESAFDGAIIGAGAGGEGNGDPAPAHEAFSWMPNTRPTPGGEFAMKVLDVCRGIEVCLQLAQASQMARDHNRWASPGNKEVPTLSVGDAETLVLFSKTVAGMLGESATTQIDFLSREGNGHA